MATGLRKQSLHTGTREISWRGSPQTRQSSGKRPQNAFSAKGRTDRPKLVSRALEKTHLQPTVPVYNKLARVRLNRSHAQEPPLPEGEPPSVGMRVGGSPSTRLNRP